ncbi:hypothetical protein BDV93DRAFT_528736 [Ceratobasidium sp. AG-I]|nr:hypothetical protein BDV93DRAFT_528736 [Ceratobasidium sp. AG-I]
MGIRKKDGYYSSNEEEPGVAPRHQKAKVRPLPTFYANVQAPGYRAYSNPTLTRRNPILASSFPTPNNTPGAELETSEARVAPGRTPTYYRFRRFSQPIHPKPTHPPEPSTPRYLRLSGRSIR